jgi:hypothetical protein
MSFVRNVFCPKCLLSEIFLSEMSLLFLKIFFCFPHCCPTKLLCERIRFEIVDSIGVKNVIFYDSFCEK